MKSEANVKALAAESWFGYGRWDAKYWFVGMEPGGTDEVASYESWRRLGAGELIDCRQHHLDCGFTHWHGDNNKGHSAYLATADSNDVRV